MIEPAAAPDRALATGLSGALGRAVYSGMYYVGFGAALPVYVAGAVFGPMSGTVARGLREGAAPRPRVPRDPSSGPPAATGARLRARHAGGRAHWLTPERGVVSALEKVRDHGFGEFHDPAGGARGGEVSR